MYIKKHKTQQRHDSDHSNDSDESSVYRFKNRDERDNPRQQIQQSEPQKIKKYAIINREGDEEEDDLEQSDIFLPEVRTQEEIMISQSYIQQKNLQDQERQLKCNSVQEAKQQNKQNHDRYITQKQIVQVLDTDDAQQIVAELEKINSWGVLSKSIDNIDITRFKDMTDKFLQIFYILMEEPQNNYIHYIEEIFKSTQMLAQLKKLLESKKDKERLYQQFFISTLGFLKISSNINIIPIDQVIAQYKIDKSLGKIYRSYENDILIDNIRELHTEKLDKENREKQKKEVQKQRSEMLQQMHGIRIDYKECPSEPTELDFQFHNNEPKPPFGQLFPVVQEGGYLSNELFINNHFYILREDYLQLFRKALWHLKQQGFNHGVQEVIKDVYVYENIMLNSMSIDRQGLQVELEISPYRFAGRQPQKINWNITKRLMSGALVMFTDEEQSVKNIFFTVLKKQADKENSLSVKVQLKLINGLLSSLTELVSLLKSGKYVYLIENKVFYDPYIHFLNCLKQIDVNKIPFKDIIIAQNNIDVKPLYLQKAYDRNYAIDYNICLKMNLNTQNLSYSGKRIHLYDPWPSQIYETLDKSQVKAIQLMLRQGIGIVQGPPGTGKTFCGALAVRILQNNRNFIDRGVKDMEHNRPILIVCYTNHALDQFLKHILAFTDKSKVVRIGGRCQDEEIQELLLQKQERSNPHFPFRDFYQNRDYLQKQFLNQTKSNEIEFRLTKQNYKKDILAICKGFLQLQSVKYQNFYLSDLTQEYIFNLWLNYDYNNLKLIHYLVVEQLETKAENNIVSINNRGYQKNNYQHYSIGILDEKQVNQQQQQRQQYVRVEQEEEDDVQLNSDEEEDRQLYQKYGDEPEIDIQQDFKRKTYTRESKYQRQNNQHIFDDLESKLNKQTQSQKYQQTINPRKLSDIWSDKIELLHKFYKLKFEQLGQEFQAEFDAFMAESRQLQDLYMDQDLRIIQSKQIVGLTVTGCAKYAKHLDKLKFGIMIIEEAAEVLESHTIAILSKNVEHLILIGDHQQLRPKLENYMIEKKYKTNISLFERLINNGINFVTLSNQRRMRTDFANIIRLIYGHEYKDHPQTQQQNQVQIKGLKHHLVFFDHQNNEKNHLDFQSSKCNEFESGIITNLVKYLIANEYASTQITVLSMYIKQVQDIKKQFLKERITGVKIQTVDNYQGEENDIIILSLVRSNNKMQLGFVGIDNRVCVALSRARLGLYVFGDFQFIKNSVEKNIYKNRNNSDLWIRIINHVRQSKNLMEQLVLQCQSHKTETIIKQLHDWRNSVHGGCQLVCNIRFDCGHVCKLKCHQMSHTKKNCPEVCDTKLQCGHKCTSYCRVIPCPPCKTIVQKYLPQCGHLQNAECHEKENQIFCKSKCQKMLTICKHPCPLLCGNNCSEAQCMVQINVRLACNHIKTINCVDRTNPKRCQCDEIISKKLRCNHIKQIRCVDRELEQQCEDQCKKKLLCGHLCKQKCYQQCQIFPCKEKVNLTRDCGHQIQVDCHNKHLELAQICQVYVTKTLNCGHIKEIKCHQLKDKFTCLEPIQISTGLCQHEFTTTCNRRNDSFSEYQCDQYCYEILDCGDQCLQVCQRCINLGFHNICKRTTQHQYYGQIGCMSEIVEDAKEIHGNVLKDLRNLKKSPLYKLIKEEDTTYFEPHQVEVARFQIKFGQQFIDLQNDFEGLDDLYYHVLELIQLPNLFQLLSKKLYFELKQKFCYAVCLAFNVIDMNACLGSYKDIQNDQIGRILKLLKGQKKCLNNLACGHRCKQEFHLNLINCVCEIEYIKKLDCGHDKTYLCQEENSICQEICHQWLNCGHLCQEICHKGNCKCEKQQNHLLKCQNHQMMVKCEKLAQLNNQIECDQFCKFKLPCGHICNQKCGECFDDIHNLCQTKVPGKYGQNVYCGQDIQNRSSLFFFQNKPDINNILKPLKQSQNLQVQQFYQNLLDKNIAFNLTSTQSIILQKQIDLIKKFIGLNQTIIDANTIKIQILNNILFREDLYLRANQAYLDQLSLAIDKLLRKPVIQFQRGSKHSDWSVPFIQ